jgi:glycosyltransferase involved in cell wall biosynthesis
VKIGFDAKRYFNNTTGLGVYSRTLVDSLAKFFPLNDYHLYSPNKVISHEKKEFNVHSYIGIFPKLFGSIWRTKGILKDLQRDKIEIYHGLSHELPKGISKTKINSVLSFHDLIFVRYPHLYPVIDRFFYHRKYRRSCLDADVIVAISEQTKQDLIQFFSIDSSKIKVVYQACDPDFIQALEVLKSEKNKDDITPYFLSVGSIIERKNLMNVLLALKSLMVQGIVLKLKVVGNRKSEYAKSCIAFATEHQLNVEFLANVTTPELAKLYSNARALMYVSHFEGFGIPILEAMHAGIPSIVSKGTCFEEVGGASSIYVNPNELGEIETALLSLQDDSFRSSFISQISSQLVKFDSKVLSLKWNEIYTNVSKK